MDQEEVNEYKRNFENLLVKKIVSIFFWVKENLIKRWGHFKGFNILDVECGCFILTFNHMEHQDEVWLAGHGLSMVTSLAWMFGP